MADPAPGELPVGPNHALLIGEVAGAIARIASVRFTDDEDGNHTDALIVQRPSGLWRVSIKPEAVAEP